MKEVDIHKMAGDIVDKFDDVLVQHEIKVPSEEDDQRDEGDDLGLYGMTYWGLVDEVEDMLRGLVAQVKAAKE